MKQQHLYEGVEYGDLETLVLGRVSIGEFKPKIGELAEVTVVGFYVIDELPADDLSRFIETGNKDILDTEVSPTTDDDGNYMVFIELPTNEDLMYNTLKVIEDTYRLCLNDVWTLEFYGDNKIDVTIKQIKAYINGKK
jgi:hypothetical protein